MAKQLPATTDSGGRQRTRAVVDAYASVFDDVQVVGFDAWPRWRDDLPEHVTVHAVGQPSPRPAAVLEGSVFAGKWFSPRLHDLLAHEVRNGDVVHVDFPQMLVNVPRGMAVDVLDLHNVESDLLQRRLRSEHPRLARILSLEVARFRHFEFAGLRRARHVTACSTLDQHVLAAAGIRSVLVPNGVAGAASEAPSPGGRRVLFVGAMDYGPNRASLRWFLDEVWPRVSAQVPGAAFDAIGRGMAAVHPRPEGESASARFHSDVPSVDPFYAAADVCVVPLLSGGGTKIKLVEALSRGRAVVTTSLGLEGLEQHRDVVRVADGAVAFARELGGLLVDTAKVRALGDAAARAVSGMSWEASMTPLRDLLISLRDGGSPEEGIRS